MTVANISEVSEFVLDGTHGSPERAEVGIPVLSAQNVRDGRLNYLTDRFTTEAEYQAFSKHLALRMGDVLLTIVGTIGRSAVIQEPRPLVFQRSVAVIRPIASKVDPQYLYHVTRTSEFQRQLQSSSNQSSQAGIYLGKLKKLTIPLPPLSEQRRIADILDRADAMRAKRRAAIAQLDTLAQSIFLDMFGDPVSNPRRWERRPLGRLLAHIDSGHSPICLDRPAAEHEWGILKLGAVTRCEYDSSANKALPQGVKPNPDLEVHRGDLLFARKNTYNLVAACALVRETRPRLMLPDLIFRLRLSPEGRMDPSFLQQLLVYPTKRREIQRLAGGSAGSMPNISKAKLATVAIESPPMALQATFAHRLGNIEQLKAVLRRSCAELDALFASLQHRAFRDEL